MLDSLRPSAAGLDEVPPWFLRLTAPYLALPITALYNLSIWESTVPSQWKSAFIVPAPKIPSPTCPADMRPISTTSILSRVLEKLIVRRFIYPAFRDPSPSLDFSNQFAFRPSGSTSAAIITNFADATNLIVPASNINTTESELDHIER